MQENDHAALARYLLKTSDSTELQNHKRAFFIGCVEPDFNPFTYMRGFVHYKKLKGHNAENAKKHILKCLKELQKSEFHSAFSYFTLGTLIHYAADSFTFPHNAAFDGSLMEHIAYEKALDAVFLQTLAKLPTTFQKTEIRDVQDFFDCRHRKYCAAEPSMQTDCRYILAVCTNLFEQLLCHSYIIVYPLLKKEDIHHESAYHNGLV